MIFLLQKTLIFAIPLLIVALAGMYAERSGIINIALDGIMIFGAFAGAIAAFGLRQNPFFVDNNQLLFALCLLIAAVAGAAFSLLLSFSAINLKADQTIGGTALNLLAPAVTLFITKVLFNKDKLEMDTAVASDGSRRDFGYALLNNDLGSVGKVFFDKAYISTFIAIGLFILLSVWIYKTKTGLRMRSCGEHPQAAASVGINVVKMRYLGTTISGALAGFGGYAYVATVEALRNAKIDQDYLDKNDVGLLYGNDSSAEPVYKSVETMLRKKNTTLIGSGGIFQSMNSTVTMNLGCIFHLRGINLTVSGACASGSHAIGLGALLIRNGLQDMVVCGGAQEINPYAVGSFDGISAFSTREDAPAKASRPFDRDRDGLVPGGGAATVIIEDYEHAVKRGAPIIAEVLSWGFSSNGDHISSPNVAGPAKSLENAIKAANIPLSEIGYVNAHATSTHIGDTNEAKAIDQIFGSHKPFVTSTKSQTGHEMWMAGASEVIYSMLMMKNDFVAANLNFENPDEDSAKLNIPGARVSTHFDTFLSNSFGFGGTNSTLIVRNL